jgi:hypothetical protein
MSSQKISTLLKIALLTLSGLLIYSFYHKVVNIDDCWLGEHAYWLAKLGFVKSELMRGITNQESRFLCHHKFLTLNGALLINIFGFSLYSLKVVALIYFSLFLIVFYKFTYKKLFTPTEFYFALLLLLSNALLFDFSFVFRPEILIMFFGFLSYIFLNKSMQDHKTSYYNIILSGIFAGFCVFTHLNGIIFILSGSLVLILNKKIKQLIVYNLATIPVIIFYFYDFTQKYNLSFWFYQLNQTPSHDRTPNVPFYITSITNLLNEHLRFFHSPREMSLTLLLIASVFLSFKYLKQYKNLMIYTLFLIILLPILSVHKATYYMIIYMPYLIIIIVLSFRNLRRNYYSNNNVNPFKSGYLALIVFVVIYVSTNLIYDIQTSMNKFSAYDNSLLSKKFIKEDTHRCNIIAPMDFMFNEIENFNRIQGEICYTEMQKLNKNIFRDGFLDLATTNNIDYIILGAYCSEKLGINLYSGDQFSKQGWTLLSKKYNMLIIKRTKIL